MAHDDTHWTITRSTGAVRYTGPDHDGAASYSTGIEFHRWLADLADDAAYTPADLDELDITDDTPSERSTDNIIKLVNGYNIDDTAAEHIYDTSIIQGAGGTEVYYDGIVNFGNSDVQIQILQSGTIMADDWWNEAGAGLNADATAGISHRFMIKTREAGADIDGRKLIGTCRRFGKTYAEFTIPATSRGNNVLALSDSTDLNNPTIEATVSGWSTIDNTTEGYAAIDVNNNSTDEYYYSEWNRAAYTINQFYERMKWLTRDGSAETFYGLSGEDFRGITHEIDVDGIASGPLNAFEELQWDSGNSSAQMLATDSVSAPTKIWIQLLTGSVPADDEVMTGQTSSATVLAELTGGSITDRPISAPFIGVSTGSALIGAYGVGVEYADLSNSDLLKALDDATYQPPNNVTFQVEGLEIGEDYVLVTPEDGSQGLDYDQFTLGTTLSASGEVAVVVGTAIPTDTPNAGSIRIVNDEGYLRRVAYTSWTGSIFTIASTAFDGAGETDSATSGNFVFLSYIDKLATSDTESFTVVFDTPRTIFIRVRDGGTAGDTEGIKTFETTGTVGSGGGSSTVIRTADL